MTDLKTIDGETLISQPLQPLNFVVDTLISQGLHILAGSPKIGKSWLFVGRLHGLRPHRQAPGCSAETVKPPEGLTPKQREKWLNEQAVLFERKCKDHASGGGQKDYAGGVRSNVASGYRSGQTGQSHAGP